MGLNENLTLSEAYDKQSKLQEDSKKIDTAVKSIYSEAHIEADRLLKRKDIIDDELEILNIEIKIRSKPFRDGTLNRNI